MNASPFKRQERKDRSQHGEDGIIQHIFDLIGTTDRFFVEIGIDSGGGEDNTRALAVRGWSGVWIDLNHIDHPFDNVKAIRARVTAENVNKVLREAGVRKQFDFLSLDIDGNDYWVLMALLFRPRVLCVEYNATRQGSTHDQSESIAYRPEINWRLGFDYFGATLAAMDGAASVKGYNLIGCESCGANAFFLRDDIEVEEFPPLTVEEAWITHRGKFRPGVSKMIPVPRRISR